MSKVFVLDANKHPLSPTHPGRARLLLSRGKAAVFKRYPFTIILKREVQAPKPEPLRLKIDPGSKTTGLALVHDGSGRVVFAAELTHRGHIIKQALADRRGVRRSRRQRHTRYRKPRFKNRRRLRYWLAPSLESRVRNVVTWVKRLMRLCPIDALTLELVKFDMQGLENPEINGAEYQQGTLAGYELREYLLEKWNRRCAYCDASGVPLEKAHWLDATCVGVSTPERLDIKGVAPLLIKACGHGCRQKCLMDKHGFPRTKAKQKQFTHGFRTGDIVQADVPPHLKNRGKHVGRMSAKANGAFTIATNSRTVTDIGKKYCRRLQRADGYRYQLKGGRDHGPLP